MVVYDPFPHYSSKACLLCRLVGPQARICSFINKAWVGGHVFGWNWLSLFQPFCVIAVSLAPRHLFLGERFWPSGTQGSPSGHGMSCTMVNSCALDDQNSSARTES